jgi:ribosome-associated translation inhibitor RaiA
MEESFELGGNIRLTGFSGLEPGNMSIIKKMVGNYAKKISENVENFEELSLTMKKVHNNAYEIHGKVNANKGPFTSVETDNNLFFAMDNVLKNILQQIK